MQTEAPAFNCRANWANGRNMEPSRARVCVLYYNNGKNQTFSLGALNMGNKKKKKGIGGLISLAVVGAGAAFVGFSSKVFDKSMKRPSNRKFDPTPYRMQSEKWAMWWDEQPTKEHSIVTPTGLKLYGYQLDCEHAPSPVTAVLIHGKTCRAKELGFLANMYSSMDIDVFAPDLRAHGKSDGDYYSMGPDEAEDLVLWLKQLSKERPNAKFLLHGVSMGAATVLLAAADKDLPGSVFAVVADCGFKDLSEQLLHVYKKEMPGFLTKPVLFTVDAIDKLRNGRSLEECSPISAVEKTELPILFIHGMQDQSIPVSDSVDMFEVARNPLSRIELFDSAEHAVSFFADTPRYADTVRTFVGDTLSALLEAPQKAD